MPNEPAEPRTVQVNAKNITVTLGLFFTIIGLLIPATWIIAKQFTRMDLMQEGHKQPQVVQVTLDDKAVQEMKQAIQAISADVAETNRNMKVLMEDVWMTRDQWGFTNRFEANLQSAGLSVSVPRPDSRDR